MKFAGSIFVAAAAAATSGVVVPKDLNVSSHNSIRNVAATLARDTMTYYSGNNTDPKSRNFGNLKQPYYWWVAGALWGAMLDYFALTGDPSYNGVVLQALLAPTNLGPNNDYMPAEHSDEEGNDDLAFWGGTSLSAAERNFPQPNANLPSWLDISINVFNQLAGRWDTAHCDGGLYWQIDANNPNGLKYKNTVSNGGFFQLASRLARATNNKTYIDWADKIWNWMVEVGFIDSQTYRVYDGAGVDSQCRAVNNKSFTYTTGFVLYGAAVLANHTGEDKWSQRADKLFAEAADYFFTGKDHNIMWEPACEPQSICNYDMITFKGYLARYMWQTTLLMPSLRTKTESLLVPSAEAAAATCTGGDDGRQCGTKWYTGGFDGGASLGAEMCALETIQGLLSQNLAPPLLAKDIKWVRDATFTPIDTYASDVTTSISSKRDVSPTAPPPSATTTHKAHENEATALGADRVWALLTMVCLVFVVLRQG